MTPDGQILMQLRDYGHGESILYKNTWALLGGRIETGETSQEAVAREYREECGRDGEFRFIGAYQYDGEGPLRGCFVDVFVTSVEESFDVQDLSEGKKFEWMSLARIKTLGKLAWQQEKVIPMIERALQHA